VVPVLYRLYPIYLIGTAAILLALAGHAWRRRTFPANREFAWFAGCAALLLASYGLELTQTRLAAMQAFTRLEWCAIPFLPPLWLLFSTVWCGTHRHLARRGVRRSLLGFSTVLFLLAQTNDRHGLIYAEAWVERSGPLAVQMVRNGPAFWVEFLYLFACLVLSSLMFLRRFRDALPLHRRQALVMLLASGLPWIIYVLYCLGLGPRGIDLSSGAVGASALLYAWAIFDQRLLDLAPVARHEAVERMRDPLLVFDGAGRMVDHNRAACRILCPDEQHSSELTRADLARLVPEWAEAFEQTEPGENRTVHHAGHTYALSLTTLQATHEQELTLCLLHDITGQARAEENLRLLNAGLEDRIAAEVASNRAKDEALARQARIAAMGEMVAAIAHQWRQPLAILSMIIQDLHEAARQGQAPSAAEWDAFKADAMAQIRHMSRTIDEFRSFQQPDTRRERFPVLPCLEESLRLSSAQSRERGILQELDAARAEPPWSYGTPSQLTQVLLSLLVNAGEAIQECRERNQGQPAQGRVALALACAGGRVQITVTDNGGGLPVELGDRIFEPYVTTKLDSGGSGLGLYLARMLVETGFGGTLNQRPQAAGACFVIELPASAAAEREFKGLERSAPMPLLG